CVVCFLLIYCLFSERYFLVCTFSLHDALPIFRSPCGRRRGTGSERPGSPRPHRRIAVRPVDRRRCRRADPDPRRRPRTSPARLQDRKSTRLNSSHVKISYAVFCLINKTITI